MDYIKFGNTELKISQLYLGCMSFGDEDPCSWINNSIAPLSDTVTASAHKAS
ncbi:hypothetical protein FACS1894182_14780 [Bacteroidia bacterium]|nr:hypothetical protein FACS1894182_14780 [Bacteroidia bacterium]